MAKDKSKKKKIKVPKRVLQLSWGKNKFAKKHDLVVKKKAPKKERKHMEKRLNNEYADFIIGNLDKAVNILSKVTNDESNKIEKLRDAIIHIIANNDVMKKVARAYKKNPDEYPYLIYLPYLINEAIMYYSQEDLDSEDQKIAEKMDREQLVAISEMILKNPIKRYRKQGVPKNVAFPVAATIPTAKRVTNNRRWMRNLIQLLYSLAETEEIDYEPILHAIPKLDKKPPFTYKDVREMFYCELIMTRSSNKNHSFTDTQKELNERFVESALEYLNGLKERKLRDILKNYIKSRKKAEEYKADGKRIIKFTDIANSNSEYEKIKTVVTDLIEENANNELYLS